MSVNNIKGFQFAILNPEGYFEFYTSEGAKINLKPGTIRISQSNKDFDRAEISFLVNVVRSVEEMQKIINE